MFPIKPGEQNHLSANMGELRSNHFHGGLDIKTDQKTGLPVYAAAEGYVSRIRASSYGYGYAVYITHPNNLITVYAHLDKFNKKIGDYFIQKQYEEQRFDIEVRPLKGEIPVSKGEVIGLSGNSGSSQAPHLHFEIRDTTDKVFNPAECGFREITDNISPVFDRIALVPFNIDSRVNGEFERKEFKASNLGSHYTIPGRITASGLIAIELKAYDRKNFAHNTYGVNHMKLLVDEKEIFSHDLNCFSFDETRYINEHVNFEVFTKTGKRFEKLYISDGNKLSTYTSQNPLKGKIKTEEGKTYKIKIIIEDDYGNQSSLSFDLQHEPINYSEIPSTTLNTGLKTEVLENILKISTQAQGNPGTTLFIKGSAKPLSPAYMRNGYVTYLYDLRNGLPDSVKAGKLKEDFCFTQPIIPGKEHTLSLDNIHLKFSPDCLADTLYLKYRKEFENGHPVFHIQDKSVSMYDTLHIKIKPEAIQGAKSLVYCMNRGKPDCEEGFLHENKIEVKTRNLGKFTLLEDTVKPVIRFVSNYGNSVKFTVFDDLSGIQSWKASLDGYWLLMNYDHKRNLMWSDRLDKTAPLKGDFIFEVTDNAGNIAVYKMTL